MRNMQVIEAEISNAFDDANAHLNSGQHLEAELAFETMIELVREQLLQQPTEENWSTLAYSLFNLAGCIKETGGNSEREPLLVEAMNTLIAHVSNQQHFIATIATELGDMHRLAEFPLIRGLDHDPSVEEMREFRRGQASGTAAWAPPLSVTSEEWHGKGIVYLLNAIRLFDSIGATRSPYFAYAYNILGELCIKTNQRQQALNVLRHAEALYQQLSLVEPMKFQNMLNDTRRLISEAELMQA